MMVDKKSKEYKQGFADGCKRGYANCRKEMAFEGKIVIRKAYWIMRKDGWYCSNCLTKHNQAHDDFCCKCGFKMSEEADLG